MSDVNQCRSIVLLGDGALQLRCSLTKDHEGEHVCMHTADWRHTWSTGRMVNVQKRRKAGMYVIGTIQAMTEPEELP